MWLRDARDLNQTRARDGVGRSKPTPETLPWWKHEHLVIDQLQDEEEEEEQWGCLSLRQGEVWRKLTNSVWDVPHLKSCETTGSNIQLGVEPMGLSSVNRLELQIPIWASPAEGGC